MNFDSRGPSIQEIRILGTIPELGPRGIDYFAIVVNGDHSMSITNEVLYHGGDVITELKAECSCGASMRRSTDPHRTDQVYGDIDSYQHSQMVRKADIESRRRY